MAAMKLATLNDGSRDGQLAVVARDLKTAHIADGIAPTLQAALDDWHFIAPQLDALYLALNAGRARRAFDFDPARCMAPLPRACQLVEAADHDGDAEPWLRQGASDDLLGPHDDIVLAHEAWGLDFGASLAAITDDVPRGATPDDAQGRIRLLMLSNALGLRNLMPPEAASGAGLLQSRPTSACSPVAVTPDELGTAWRGGKVHLPVRATWNGRPVGQVDAGSGMRVNFAHLISYLCKTRKARAGSIVGAGTLADGDAGYACIAQQRLLEIREHGEAVTGYLRFGDTIRIEMLDDAGKSLFGAIEQTVKTAG